jgi:hypothetical protein
MKLGNMAMEIHSIYQKKLSAMLECLSGLLCKKDRISIKHDQVLANHHCDITLPQTEKVTRMERNIRK